HWVAPGVSHNAMEGDGVVAQIDPFEGYTHYYGTGPEGRISRSDDAGTFFSAATWTFFPGTQWWSPFYCHPLSAGVVFTGGTRVWRSDARGNAGTWTDITSDLAEPMRSMGFHPTNARVLYVGTIGGHVYRLTGPAAGAWTSATVTTDDVTFTGLPSGIGISSIAVDTSGNVWITSSDIVHTEATGEFSNDHVFRLDAGATAWVAKSNGLVVANPMNAIVIDPADSTRVFCGGDRGVFAWSAATATWTLLDQGLPNAPVIELAVHAPSRKLRAATHGRGVWERSLDAAGCSDHFLYLRDNLVDAGRTPSLDHVPHPYIPGARCYHWQSEDIIVDPVAQTPSLVTSAMELYDKVVHMGAQRGANRIYVTAHNKGPFAITDVRVRAFFAPASMGLPPLPAGLLADPFGWNPAGPSVWTPVSPASFPIARIDPGTTRLASWSFSVPMSAPRHSCLLAFVTSGEDPFATGGITNPDELVVNNRKVALRNLDLDAMPGSGAGGSDGGGGGGLPAGTVARELKMYGENLGRAMIVASNLPDDTVFVVALGRAALKTFQAEETKVSRRAEKVRDRIAKESGRAFREYDFDRAIVREAKRGAEILIGEARLEHGRPVPLLVAVHSGKWEREQTYSFDVIQMAGEKVVGGYTVQLVDPERVPKGASGDKRID
ncbi:MAG: WD40/YVTN/BNR-like repeat-containing protein, partial [Thermoanaerobaculia bacterium]